ncbi:MAG: AMP-binding protein, partial [Bacteroidota bacterium]
TRRLNLDIDWPANQSNTNPSSTVTPDNLAYLIYTSGSTGQPKGIMHTHASGLAFARLTAATAGLTAEDRFGSHAPIYFDVSQLGYFTAPLLGASTVIVSDGHTIFPASLRNLIEQEELTVWYSVPLALIQLLTSGLIEAGEFPKLRKLFYAGEPFAPKYLRQLMEAMPHVQFTNWYGPAETNVCTYYDLTAPPVGDEQVPIGKVWGNTDYLLLDDELLIRSATTMAGYWNRPELTERAFYRTGGPGSPQATYYRTGDRAQLDDDGNLHFLGRKDHQVKVRGYRVETTAVENRLQAHSNVHEAAVLALPGEDGATLRLTAFVVPAGEVTAKELTTFAGQALTWYAVPEAIHFLTDFPRTGSGKIDRPALRDYPLS